MGWNLCANSLASDLSQVYNHTRYLNLIRQYLKAGKRAELICWQGEALIERAQFCAFSAPRV